MKIKKNNKNNKNNKNKKTICKNYKKYKKINLNYASIKTNKKCKDNSILLNNKKYNFFYKNTELCKKKYISQGAYGKIYKYYNKDIEIAVKFFKYSNDSEIKINRKTK